MTNEKLIKINRVIKQLDPNGEFDRLSLIYALEDDEFLSTIENRASQDEELYYEVRGA